MNPARLATLPSRFVVASFLALLSAGCGAGDAPHEHAADHPAGHDHHAPGHGHGDTDVRTQTLWNDAFELYLEHEAGEPGHSTTVLLHLTRLEDFRPWSAKDLSLTFEGPASLVAAFVAAPAPGVFEFAVTPAAAGRYRGRLVAAARPDAPIDGIAFEVAANAADEQTHDRAGGDEDDHEDEGLVEFLKEQQWAVPFATAFTTESTLLPSLDLAGEITTPPGGRAELAAPVTGRLEAPAEGWPLPGSDVAQGQVLAWVRPAPAASENAAATGLAIAEARARVETAEAALARAERLVAVEALPLRRAEEARREVAVAREALATAHRSAAAFEGSGGAPLPIASPLAGRLDPVDVHPGAIVGPGHTLFRIVDPSRLWVAVDIPEREASRLAGEREATVTLPESAGAMTGSFAASLISAAASVDAHSRTVRALYRLAATDERLRVGGLVRVAVPVGEPANGIVVPRSALVDRDGMNVVYVQTDGEHFEERVVRIGARQADRVLVETGLAAQERIVTRGAHLLRLAERATSEPAHGHIH